MNIRTKFPNKALAAVFFSFFALWVGFSCQNGVKSDDSQWAYFGDSITVEGAKDVSELPDLMKGKTMAVFKLSGTIQECCQKKGCWMKLDMGNGQMLRVGFKDYAFFMPLESAGSKIVMQGMGTYDTTTVDELKHYAEDAGKSKDEIAAITEPELELVFEASGVRLRK